MSRSHRYSSKYALPFKIIGVTTLIDRNLKKAIGQTLTLRIEGVEDDHTVTEDALRPRLGDTINRHTATLDYIVPQCALLWT